MKKSYLGEDPGTGIKEIQRKRSKDYREKESK